jgi:hypothetical protein
LAKLEKMFILMYPLVNKQLLKMAIYSWFTHKNCDFP